MNEYSTHTELLIRLLDGELNENELAAAKKIIAENPFVREEFENLQIAKNAVNTYGLKTTIGSIHKEMMQEIKSPATALTRKIFHYGLRIAAVLIVLFGLSAVYQYLTATPEKLFSENFHAYELHKTRGSSNTTLEDLYEEGDLNGLIQQYDQLKSPEAKDCFLAGNAYLSTHRSSNAIEAFTRLERINKTNNTHFFEEDVEYFLALSYLGNNEPAKALPLFEKIHADPNHPFNSAVSSWFLLKIKRSVSVH
jgi:hypothetical protein